jgi:hypothetical protein
VSTTYQPGFIPDDAQQIAPALRQEFVALKAGLEDAAPSHRWQVLYTAPRRVQAGMVINASSTLGATADFGRGAGLYQRNEDNDAWVFVPGDTGWRDIIGKVEPKVFGAGSPARAIYAGGNIADFAFVANDVCDFVYHIPHDYLPGSDLHFHIHWSHNDAVSVTGNATFTMYHTYAKGFNQENFPAEKNIAITYATTDLATTPQYRMRVDEAQLSSDGGSATLMDSSLLEPDGILLLTLQLTALPTFGGAGKLFIHTCDIHYQSTSLGTPNKAPPFN